MRRRPEIWIVLSLAAVVWGCETKLDNPADPEADAFLGVWPWVDAGEELRATINDTLTFRGVFYGPLDKVESYEWDFDGDGHIDSFSEAGAEARWTYTEVGVYRAVFAVRDRAGFSERDTTLAEITDEVPVPNGGPDRNGFLDRAVALAAGGTDDGRILEYRWDYQADGEVDWTSNNPETAYVFYPEPRVYRAVLEVVDDDDHLARDTVAVSISLGAPVARAGADTAVSIYDRVIFRGSGVDSNGTVVYFEWDFDGDGLGDRVSESTGLAEWEFGAEGTYLAVLTVRDDDGLTDSDTAQVSVTNLPPVVETRDLGLGWCAEPETLFARVADDGRVVLYEWDFDGDGVVDWVSDTSGEAIHHFSRGTYSILLRVADDDGNTTTETLTYRVSPWATGKSMNFPRTGVGVEAVDGMLFALAGYSPEIGAYSALAEAYDPGSNTWELRKSMAMTQYGMATAVVGDRIFGVAGCASGEERGTIEEYWPYWDRWMRRASLRQRRCWPAAASYDGLVYVFGGVSEDEIATVEVYDPRHEYGSGVPPMPTARHGMAAVALGDRIYLIGGVGGGRTLATVEAYEPATYTWETRAPMPTPRTSLAAVVWNGKIYAIGGSYLDVVEVYDPGTDTWRSATPMPTARYGPGAAVIGDRIYVVGGRTTGSYLATLEVYAPACDE